MCLQLLTHRATPSKMSGRPKFPSCLSLSQTPGTYAASSHPSLLPSLLSFLTRSRLRSYVYADRASRLMVSTRQLKFKRIHSCLKPYFSCKVKRSAHRFFCLFFFFAERARNSIETIRSVRRGRCTWCILSGVGEHEHGSG